MPDQSKPEASVTLFCKIESELMDRLERSVLQERKRRGERKLSKSTLVREALAAHLARIEKRRLGDG